MTTNPIETVGAYLSLDVEFSTYSYTSEPKFRLANQEQKNLLPIPIGTIVTIGKNSYVIVKDFVNSISNLPPRQFTHDLKLTLKKGTVVSLQNSIPFALIDNQNITVPIDCDIILLPETKLQQVDTCVFLQIFRQEKAKIVPHVPGNYGLKGDVGVKGLVGDIGITVEKNDSVKNSCMGPELVQIMIDPETILTRKVSKKFNKNPDNVTKLSITKGTLTYGIPAGSIIKIGNNTYTIVINFVDNIQNLPIVNPSVEVSHTIPEKTKIEMENGIIVKLGESININISPHANIIIPHGTRLQQTDTAAQFILRQNQTATLVPPTQASPKLNKPYEDYYCRRCSGFVESNQSNGYCAHCNTR